jgi:hypothetical protein
MITKIVNVQQNQNISIAQLTTSESNSFNSEDNSGFRLAFSQHLIHLTASHKRNGETKLSASDITETH